MQTFRETVSVRKGFVCLSVRSTSARWCVSALFRRTVQSILPPLCKGRWIAKRDGRVVVGNHVLQPLSHLTVTAPLTQGSHGAKRRRDCRIPSVRSPCLKTTFSRATPCELLLYMPSVSDNRRLCSRSACCREDPMRSRTPHMRCMRCRQCSRARSRRIRNAPTRVRFRNRRRTL